MAGIGLPAGSGRLRLCTRRNGQLHNRLHYAMYMLFDCRHLRVHQLELFHYINGISIIVMSQLPFVSIAVSSVLATNTSLMITFRNLFYYIARNLSFVYERICGSDANFLDIMQGFIDSRYGFCMLPSITSRAITVVFICKNPNHVDPFLEIIFR